MGDPEDRYGEPKGFTPYQPYQPDPAPEGEPAADEPPPQPQPQPQPTFVPYGGEPLVPYGGVPVAVFATTARRSRFGFGCGPWLIGVVFLLFSCGGGCTAIIGSLASSGPDVTVGDAPVSANELEEGQCVNGAGLDPSDDNPVSGMEVVACTTTHDGEVLAVNVLDSDEAAAYDFDDDSQIDANCRPFFSDREQEILQADDYFIWALTETSTPVTGDKVACIVVDAQGDPLHGPVDMAAPSPAG